MPGQNTLIDAMDRLRAAASCDQRWTMATALLGDIGSDWITAGTTSRRAQTALAIRTSTPAALMRDYLAARMLLDDPWMQHCAATTGLDMVAPGAPRGTATRLPVRQTQLFADHGIKLALLVPCYGGARPGGIVLYARSADAALRMADPGGQAEIRLLTALVAAHYRPEDDSSGSPERYDVHALLSDREREVQLWLSRGLQSAAIAGCMGIAPVTVAKHLHSARRKLGARTREQALAIAVRDRLIAI